MVKRAPWLACVLRACLPAGLPAAYSPSPTAQPLAPLLAAAAAGATSQLQSTAVHPVYPALPADRSTPGPGGRGGGHCRLARLGRTRRPHSSRTMTFGPSIRWAYDGASGQGRPIDRKTPASFPTIQESAFLHRNRFNPSIDSTDKYNTIRRTQAQQSRRASDASRQKNNGNANSKRKRALLNSSAHAPMQSKTSPLCTLLG